MLQQTVVAERLDRPLGTHTSMAGTGLDVTSDSGGLRVNGREIVRHQLDVVDAAVYIVNDLVPQR